LASKLANAHNLCYKYLVWVYDLTLLSYSLWTFQSKEDAIWKRFDPHKFWFKNSKYHKTFKFQSWTSTWECFPLFPTQFYFMWEFVCILFHSLHVLVPYVFFSLRKDTLLFMLGIGHAPKLWLWHSPPLTKHKKLIFSPPITCG
jgi:hypothetical protein